MNHQYNRKRKKTKETHKNNYPHMILPKYKMGQSCKENPNQQTKEGNGIP